MTDDEIDICPECVHHDGSRCTQEDINDDPRHDHDMMVDECVHFDEK